MESGGEPGTGFCIPFFTCSAIWPVSMMWGVRTPNEDGTPSTDGLFLPSTRGRAVSEFRRNSQFGECAIDRMVLVFVWELPWTQQSAPARWEKVGASVYRRTEVVQRDPHIATSKGTTIWRPRLHTIDRATMRPRTRKKSPSLPAAML